MKHRHPLAWLFLVLLLVGQHAGLLHGLGHGLESAGRVIAAGEPNAEYGEAPLHSQRDGHAEACPLCAGLGGAAAAAPASFAAPLLPALARARPLAPAPWLRALAGKATPIRGPPPSFSA